MQKNILLAICIIIIILVFYIFGFTPALLLTGILIINNYQKYKGGNEDFIYVSHGIKKDSINKFNNIIANGCIKSKNYILDKSECDYTKNQKTLIMNDKKMFEDEYNPNFNSHVYTNIVTNIKYYLNNKKNMYDMFLLFKIPISYIKEKYDYNKNLLKNTLWKDKYVKENKFPLTLFANSDVMAFSDYIPIKFLDHVYVSDKDTYDNLDYTNKTYIENITFQEIYSFYNSDDILEIYKNNPGLNTEIPLKDQNDDIKNNILTQHQDLLLKRVMNNIIKYCNLT